MKTRKDCFDEARQQFVRENGGLVRRIENEAEKEADALFLTKEEFISCEIKKAFGIYIRGFGDDSSVQVIKMTTPDEAEQKRLLTEYYQEVADSLLMPLDVFLRENDIQL